VLGLSLHPSLGVCWKFLKLSERSLDLSSPLMIFYDYLAIILLVRFIQNLDIAVTDQCLPTIRVGEEGFMHCASRALVQA